MVPVLDVQLLPRARALPASKANKELLKLDDAHHPSVVGIVALLG